jgi:pilus assembly protein CpaB
MARISTGTMTVAIFAVLFGLVGAYALRAALTKPEVEPPPPPKTVTVPIAAASIPAGRQIVQGDMVLVPMTAEDMRNRKYNLEQVMLDPGQIIGRILQTEMKSGDPFLTVNLFAQGTGPKLSDKLKPGMRAVTIPIDNLSAVGGSTVEGSFVDVLFRAKKRDADLANDRPEIPATTVTLLENVEVLSVGRMEPAARRGQNDTLDVRLNNIGASTGAGGSFLGGPVVHVTIAVSPDQANVVKAVLGQGDMSLSLRNESPAPNQQGAVNPNGGVTPNKYTLEGILGIKSAEAGGLDKIEVFRGSIGRQNIFYQNNKWSRDENGLVSGLTPGLTFPVPAQVPAAKSSTKSATPDKDYGPSPKIINGGIDPNEWRYMRRYYGG